MLYEITNQNVPRMFQLSWDKNTKSISCILHNSAITMLRKLDENNPFVSGFMKQFGFSTFSNSDKGENYGFDECFKVKNSPVPDTILFIAKLPPVVKDIGLCGACRGSGEGFSFGGCLHCNGTKRQWAQDFKPASALSASLNILLMSAKVVDERSSWDSYQLLDIDLCTDVGVYGGALSGHFSGAFISWLFGTSFYEDISPKLIKAMNAAHDSFFPNWHVGLQGFRAELWDKWRLILDCPGNACGIHPSDNDRWEKDQGYQFACHNVDTAPQQLTLVVGLAKLCDLYEESNKQPSSI